jgi:tetratricopeptide (TPR) repeat protein
MDNDKIEELKEKVANDPSSKLFLPLAEEYRKAGMLDEAVEVLQQGIERQPKYTSAVVALGKIYLEKEMFAEARSEFEKVVAQVPDNLFAQRKLADAYKKLGERDLAVEQYRKVIKLNPMDEEAQGILEELSKSPVTAPAEDLESVEELPAEEEGTVLEFEEDTDVDEFASTEKLTPIEEEEAEQEFFEAFEEEAAPVDVFPESFEGEAAPSDVFPESFEGESAPSDVFPEAIEEAESAEDIAEAFEFENVEEEEEFLEALEEAAPVEGLVEAAAEAAAILEETAFADEDMEALEEAEPVEDIAEALEEEEFLEAMEGEAPLEELVEAGEEAAEMFEEAAPVDEAVEAEEEVEEIEEEVEEVIEAATPAEEEADEVEEEVGKEVLEEVPVGEEAIEMEGEVAEALEEAAPVEEAVEAEEEVEEVIEAAAPAEEEAVGVEEEAGFGDLAEIAAGEEEPTVQKAEEYVAKADYTKAVSVYKEVLAHNPENIDAKQGLQEIESLLKLMGTEKEVIIARLELFLEAIMKRKDEFYRNA